MTLRIPCKAKELELFHDVIQFLMKSVVLTNLQKALPRVYGGEEGRQ